MSKYSFNKNPTCPWCDHEQQDCWDYRWPLEDDYTTEIECGSCEKKISVTQHLEVTYSTTGIGCEKHLLDFNGMYCDLWNSTPQILNFECKYCKREYYDWQLDGGKHEKLKKHQYEFIGRAKEVMEARESRNL